MKKVKNLLLVALFGLFSFAFLGIVNAATIANDSLFLRNGGADGPRLIDMVCEPASLTENGAKSRCYLIGILKSGGDGLTEVNGFAVQVYTTEYLRLNASYVNDGIGTTKAGTIMMDVSTVNTTPSIPSDAPTSISNYKCYRGETTNIAGNAVDPLDYKCALFYTKKTQTTAAYNLTTLQSGHKVDTNLSQATGSAGVGLIGSFEVQLDTDEKNVVDCGEICYMLWEIPTEKDYDNSTCAENPDAEECQSTKKQYSCKEISVVVKTPTIIEEPPAPEDPETPPSTGAFTSYAILAAGALIAVGAIAMAKKNNKFNRI